MFDCVDLGNMRFYVSGFLEFFCFCFGGGGVFCIVFVVGLDAGKVCEKRREEKGSGWVQSFVSRCCGFMVGMLIGSFIAAIV